MKPFVRLDDLPMVEQSHGTTYAAGMAQVGATLGAQLLGCRLTVVPPGKAAWPFHNHHANEELFVILSGEGTLRYGAERHPVGAGAVVLCRAGGPDTAPQLLNTGTGELRYLAISPMREPDVTEYPATGTFGVTTGAAPGGDKAARRFQFHGRPTGASDYWEDA